MDRARIPEHRGWRWRLLDVHEGAAFWEGAQEINEGMHVRTEVEGLHEDQMWDTFVLTFPERLPLLVPPRRLPFAIWPRSKVEQLREVGRAVGHGNAGIAAFLALHPDDDYYQVRWQRDVLIEEGAFEDVA